MANVRIKDITTTASAPNDDDYLAIDGATGGTRKVLAKDLQTEIDTTLTIAGKAADAKVVGDKITGLEDDLDKLFCPNLMGNKSGVNYPVFIPAGGKFTISTSDGSIFSTDSTLVVLLKDSNGSQTDYFTLKNGAKYRTIATNSSRADTYFLSWNQVPSVPLMVNYGTEALDYIEYFESADVKLNQIDEIQERLNTITQTPELRNGSLGNGSNGYYVATKYVIPTNNAKGIYLEKNIGTSEENPYDWILWTYSTSGIATPGSAYKINQYDPYITTEKNHIYIEFDSNVQGFGVSLAIASSVPDREPLRIANVGNCITFMYIYGPDEDIIPESLYKLQIARHVKGNTVTPLTLLHFSDIHADKEALNRIVNDADSYGELIDDIICTGDMVANNYGSITSWWNNAVLTCIGNHDTASYSSANGYNWTALSMADRDTYYIAPFESNWNVVHTSGTSYYYKDYAESNVRLIVMDGMLYNDNGTEATIQTAWLENLLSDAITNDLHVLIAIHAPHGGAAAIDCSFSRYGATTKATESDCNTPQTVIDLVAAKITAGLKFIGYLVGHTHQDNIWDAENDRSQLMFCVACANVANNAQWKNTDLHRSVNLDAYNLVTIDTDNTLVKIIRGGGADIDDHMRTRKAICFDYSTGKKVGEVL